MAVRAQKMYQKDLSQSTQSLCLIVCRRGVQHSTSPKIQFNWSHSNTNSCYPFWKAGGAVAFESLILLQSWQSPLESVAHSMWEFCGVSSFENPNHLLMVLLVAKRCKMEMLFKPSTLFHTILSALNHNDFPSGRVIIL